jgi:hypothetical protein
MSRMFKKNKADDHQKQNQEKDASADTVSSSKSDNKQTDLRLPETDIVNYNSTGVLQEEVEVPSVKINGRQVPGWQTQRDEQGRLHSEPEPDSKPSLIHQNRLQEWHNHGQLHREHDLPARIHANGVSEYWHNGVFQGASVGGGKPSHLRNKKQSTSSTKGSDSGSTANRQQRRQEKKNSRKKR